VTRSRAFGLITAADFIVRSGYQLGKTPVLPVFAMTLGAGELFLGFIVSASTLTGLVLKPMVGILSDRWGRRMWLLLGTSFFAGIPFLYWLVHTPEQLLALRLVHGLATAIYGPVTLAYVSELSSDNRAERLGWFSSARSAGYVIGPLAGGVMLVFVGPVAVFTLIGLLSATAFVPVVLLPETRRPTRESKPVLSNAVTALRSCGRSSGVWLAGGLNAQVLVGKYAAKAFLPIYAMGLGQSLALVGLFFALQESVTMLVNPIGGRLSDRFGYVPVTSGGMAVIGGGLLMLAAAEDGMSLMVTAVLMGAGQGLVFPAAVALVSSQVDERNLGLGMGLVGAMKNGAKVAGPIVAGVLIETFGYEPTFRLLGLVVLIGAAVVLLAQTSRPSLPKRARGTLASAGEQGG